MKAGTRTPRVSGSMRSRDHDPLTEASLLEHQIHGHVLELAAELDELISRFERAAVESSELPKQLASPLRIGPDEHGDGVDGVEQEVRIDLRLEGFEFHSCGEFGLTLELR